MLAFFLFTFAYSAQIIKKFYLSKASQQSLIAISVFLAIGALASVRKIGEWQLVWTSWYLLLAIQVLYLFQPKKTPGWLSSYLLSALQLGIAAEYTKSPAFFIFYLLFLALSPLGFSILIIKSEVKESINKFLKPKLPYIKWLSSTTLSVFFLTAIIFIALPRAKKPFLATREKKGLIPKLQQTGLSDSQIIKGEKFCFRPEVSLGEFSEYKKKKTILMLVETDKPFLWRVEAFNDFEFKSGVWSIKVKDRRQFTLQNGYLRLKPLYLSQASLIRMRPQQFIHHKFYIKNFTGNLLPCAYQVLEIGDLPATRVNVDVSENIYLPQQLKFNTSYNVVSIQKIFPSHILRSLPRKYPEKIKKLYLQLPPNLDDRIVKLTAKILKDIPPVQYDEVATLQKFLIRNYTYTAQRLSGENQLSKFLFEDFRGDCEYFATALVIMLRIAGIPARLVIGFSKGDYDPVSRITIVTPEYAHAWVEVYFPEVGWLTCDPIPNGVNAQQWSETPSPEIPKSEILTLAKEEITPPEEELVPPEEAAPEEEITPPEEAAAPPEEEITPPEEELVSPEEAAPEEEVTPPQEEEAPPEEEITPPEEELAPPEEAAPEEEVTPPEEEAALPEEEITPPEEELAPP
ncbi:MAG: transglutaminase domain-containing protein, partial [Candidatus Omnitrophica bacterium]|nr:transglutaminase domain-containing protein [Candidatus Omnitrophota bacterium]